ncbi:MAG: hypothetical protein RLZZ200_2951 [Pseudomonadota bacterium]|jgi:uncharacterized DUF497 family protein
MGADVAPMELEFDPDKDRRNRAKHGISLAMALHLDWDSLDVVPDLRRPYGENHYIGDGIIDSRLHCVVYTTRSAVVRIISLRKANSREGLKYGKDGPPAH